MKKIFSIIALAMLTLAVATSCSDDDVYPAKLKVYGEGIANGEVNLKAQETVQIQLSYWPEYSIKDSIEYRSTNENVATVDKNGLVRGIDTGTATILIKQVFGSGFPGRFSVFLLLSGGSVRPELHCHIGTDVQ